MNAIIKKIKSELREMLRKEGLDLPKRGYLAGQSIATLYLEAIGFDKYKEKKDRVINDVDIFVETKKKYKDNRLMQKGDEVLCRTDYGRFLTTTEINRYKVVKTKHIKSLNLTFFSKNEYSNMDITPTVLIEKFDLNCTQICLDLKTNKLYKSENFEQFVKTGQLSVVDLVTPEHTAIRIVKKEKEFGFYCNLEKELNLLASRFSRQAKFGPKYTKLFREHKDILETYFTIKKVKINKWKAKLRSLSMLVPTPKCKPFIDYACNFIGHSDMLIKRAAEIYFGLNKENSKLKVEYFKEYNLKNKDEDNNYSFGYLLMMKYYQKGLVFENFSSIIKMAKEHRGLEYIYFDKFKSYTELIEFHKNFKKLIFEKGIGVIGIFENSILPNISPDYESLLGIYNEYIADYTKPLIKRTVKDFKYFNYVGRELLTKLELQIEADKQKHCVSGYGYAVQSGVSKIISLTSANNNEPNYTVELRRISKNQYYIAQCMAKFNVPMERSKLDYLAKVINDNYEHELICERKKEDVDNQNIYDEDGDIPF